MAIRRSIKLIIGIPLALALLGIAGSFVYIHFIEGPAPAKLSLSSGSSTTGAAAGADGSIDGTWKVAAGSQAGYRVQEILFGQRATAVGRTSGVTGTMTIRGTAVTAADITVDLTSVSSDQDRRDSQFRGRIMNVASFPTATFKLTTPIDLGTASTSGSATVKASGDLTLRGTTKPVTVDLQAQRAGSGIKVAGSIPIVFADWNIPNPSLGPAETEDHGVIELLVQFAR